jgi:ABC-type branched-subunit amino acid transport system substrate-binding protein
MKKSIFFILFCSGSLFAQLTDQQYLSTYKEAVSLFEQQSYDEAYAKLTPLTTRKYTNAVAPYAFLYGALSAEKKGNKYQSKILFRNLFTNYPEWDKLNDAKVLYARNNFEDGYFEEAMKVLHEIEDDKYKTVKIGLMEEYIKNIKTVSALKNIYTKFPNYKPVARALVDKIQANRYNSKADLELSDMLTNRFNLLEPEKKTSQKDTDSKPKGKTKAQLNFGLLLPFETSNSGQPNASVTYVYDIYAGMQIAAEKLSPQGINLKIHTYDVRSNANEFKTAENKAGFSDLDLIVGPLYPGTNNLAIKFINDNDIFQVHPISNNLDLLKNSKNSFLMQPSHTQQTKKTLDYVASLGATKSVSVYYGGAKKDSTFATIYASEAKKKGFTITELKRFNGQKLPAQRGHIFFAGDNNLGSTFIQSIEMADITCEVIMTASSFSWDKTTATSFSQNMALIYPEYVNREKEAVKEFEKSYFEKTAAFPSYYSYLGYDLAYYFASMLKDGKSIFKINLDLGEYIEDYMLSGYDFSDKVKQNEVVPIIKYRDGNFEEVFR